jgi:hypothetical protein
LINAQAASPRLNLKAKASLWLLSHHLRSLNTVNTRLLYEKKHSTKRVIFGCFEFTLLGMPEVKRLVARTDFCPFQKKTAQSRI